MGTPKSPFTAPSRWNQAGRFSDGWKFSTRTVTFAIISADRKRLLRAVPNYWSEGAGGVVNCHMS
jgi:hypothetical protein